MSRKRKNRPNAQFQEIHPLEAEWGSLCERYLPVDPGTGIWRYSRAPGPEDPEQGWKLHISATVLSATAVFTKTAPFLTRRGIMFKAPRALEELGRINSGMHHRFSQIGKFITVYPRNTAEAVVLAKSLDRLTRGLPAPGVPYDCRFGKNSCVHYRYGGFGSLQKTEKKRRVAAIRMPNGKLVADRREPGAAVPSWLTDPFAKQATIRKPKVKTPLATIRAYAALSQRGKGGVYRALDLSRAPARLCVLKEGRRHGETDYFGRDGYWRVQREHRVLRSLRKAGIPTPKIRQAFEVDDHYYLVTEYIEGENLQDYIKRSRRSLTVSEAVRYARELTNLVSEIHAAGWVWRDCKPLNVIVCNDGSLRPVDFEGACEITVFDPTGWGTPGYVPPVPRGLETSLVTEDLYALGASLYHLFTRRRPSRKRFPRLQPDALPGLPPEVVRITNALLDPEPSARPGALTVLKTLHACQARLEKTLPLAA